MRKELIEHAEEMLATAQEHLVTSRYVLPVAEILTPQKSEVLGMPYKNDDERLQSQMLVVERALTVKAEAVFIVADIYVATYTQPADEDRGEHVIEHVTERADFVRPMNRPDRRECLLVYAFTPQEIYCVARFYQRRGRQILWEETERHTEAEGVTSEWDPWQLARLPRPRKNENPV